MQGWDPGILGKQSCTSLVPLRTSAGHEPVGELKQGSPDGLSTTGPAGATRGRFCSGLPEGRSGGSATVPAVPSLGPGSAASVALTLAPLLPRRWPVPPRRPRSSPPPHGTLALPSGRAEAAPPQPGAGAAAARGPCREGRLPLLVPLPRAARRRLPRAAPARGRWRRPRDRRV